MALSIDHATKVITIPQADLTLISGSLFELDTEVVFRQGVNALLDDEAGIVLDDAISHNTEVTVAGTTFARTIEIINGFSVTFTPDSQYTVRLAGSNNNLFDVENAILNQNQVQIISQNSGGLIVFTSGSGVLAADIVAIKNAIFDELMEGSEDFRQQQVIMRAESAGKVGVTGGGTTVKFRDRADTKDRIDATVDANGQRTAVTTDGT